MRPARAADRVVGGTTSFPESVILPRCTPPLKNPTLLAQGSQFIVATHSPILLSVPGARILQIDDTGRIERVSYDDAEPVNLTRVFLADPDQFLRHLLPHHQG